MERINILFLVLIASALLACTLIPSKPTQVKFLKNDPFASAWRKIDSLQNQGLPESANKEVQALLPQLRTLNDVDQIIRCHLYSAKYTQELNEEGAKKGINYLEEQLTQAKGLELAVLYSIIGETYIQFLNNNRWKINQRTELSRSNDDVLTWTTNQFIDKAKDYYLKSLGQGDWLKLPVSELEFILTQQKNVEQLRPTIFDFLAHRAIDHFSNTRNLITEPTNVFLLNDEKVFGTTNEFLNINFNTDNEDSGVYQALLIIQELTRHHKELGNIPALMEVERKRLLFAKSYATNENKDELYLARLKAFLSTYEKETNAGDFKYDMANYYFQKANEQAYDLKNRTPDAFINAKKMAEECIKQYPKSWGAEQCKAIVSQIGQRELNISIESANPENDDFLIGVKFRNINTFHVAVYNYDESLKNKLKKARQKEEPQIFNKLDPIKSWDFPLNYKQDYYTHQTEFPIEGIGFGEYIVVVSESKKLSAEQFYRRANFTITNLSFIALNNNFQAQGYLVTHRKTGNPVPGVTVEQWTNQRGLTGQKEVLVSTEISDENGRVNFNVSNNNSYFFKLRKGEDKFRPDRRFYGQRRFDNKPSESVSFFLDRKIYRPGQTIYFKGIAISKNKDRRPSIISNKKYEVRFLDPNRQEVQTVNLTTNEFGSFQGSFIAPEGGLLGRFTIRTSNSSVAFNIEEYKRPKFQVEIEAPTEETSLNQMITINGNAMAFAGYPIDQAKVSYRISRQAFFPWCPWWRIPSYYNRSQAEIANGIIATDDNGKFSIEFKALPDLTIKEDDRPEYNFTIAVDVTDGTGETRSTSYSLRAGTIGFNLSHNIKDEVRLEDFDEIMVQSKNLNGTFVPVQVETKILRLKKPKSIIKDRYYQIPDIPFLEKEAFYKQFPLYAYGEEAAKHTWEVEQEVWKDDWKTAEGEARTFENTNFTAGAYKIIITGKDKFNKEATLESIVEVYEEKGGNLPGTNWVWIPTTNSTYQPGDVFTQSVFGKEETKIYYQFLRNAEILKDGWSEISRNSNLITELTKTVEEQDKGNFFLNIICVKENRYIANSSTIAVPWSDKNLVIETSTFRDKLRPGDDETWSFKLSGEKKDKVAAEVVAAMYDASLDAFKANSYGLNLWPQNYSRSNIVATGFGQSNGRGNYPNQNFYQPNLQRTYPQLNLFGYYPFDGGRRFRGEMLTGAEVASSAPRKMSKSSPMSAPADFGNLQSDAAMENESLEESDDQAADLDSGADKKSEDPVRTNLNETVFFLPQLKTDADGNLTFSFKMNEALTSWKLLMQAHDKELRTGTLTREVVTQKELMVVPNPPRFFREGDKIEFTAKVVNLTDESMTGEVVLTLSNALSGENINQLIANNNATQSLTLAPKASASFSWLLDIPKSYLPAITHKIVARAANFSDGEQEDRPVLTNRLLVTETFPMPVRAKETKSFDFSRIQEVQKSSSATAHNYAIEFTSNPAWYAVLALPYLMEYPYECSEQIFSRYYANTIAAGIANKYPRIKSVFEKWENTDALLSNLSKNEELKSALLEETPWVLQAQSEAEQRKNIGLLFNLEKLGREKQKAINQLKGRQQGDGGFAWFKGGYSSTYITEYILTGFKRLEQMKFLDPGQLNDLLNKGRTFIDQRFARDFEALKSRLDKNNQDLDPEKDYLNPRHIHYLFTRSFFNEPIPKNTREAYDFYQKQAEKFWMKKGLQNQAQIALIFNRSDRRTLAMNILKSFRERALHHDELGMYWKMDGGYYWYNNSLETHAFMINCLQEIDPQQRELEDLQTWLLKHKQTNAWETTKGTAMAIYTLLMTGVNPGASLANSELAEVSIGGQKLNIENAEAGTGYFKTSYSSEDIPPAGHAVKVNNPNDNIAWGATYFQYFEDMDKVTAFEETPLHIKKEVFLEEKTKEGPKLKALSSVTLNPGDRLKVRIEVRVDRDMEFVHLKDHRASGLEPENVLSGYRWQGALGYYESTKDASTNFFIGFLPKGTHVFEYPLRVVHEGEFSNGITTMQSMYAPEFSTHSEGIRIKVGD